MICCGLFNLFGIFVDRNNLILMNMYKIQANKSGTRHIDITEEHLATIKEYSLFQGLADSHGIIDEPVLDRLKLNVRSLLVSENTSSKALLDLCIDVIYHKNMKAFGLKQLLDLYNEWVKASETECNEEQ